MKKSEISKTLVFLSKSYLGKVKYPSNNQEEDIALEETWLSWIKDFKYETIMMVLRDLMPHTPEWPPSPMQVVNRINEIAKTPEERMTADEAWDRVIEIVHRPHHYETDDEFLKDEPDTIKRAIKSMGGLNCIRYTDVDDSWPRKRFVDAYNNINERLEHEPLPELSSSIQKDITQLGDGMRMIGKEK